MELRLLADQVAWEEACPRQDGEVYEPQRDGQGLAVRAAVTDRLTLAPLRSQHLDEVFQLHTDPRVWEHFPGGRHVNRKQSEQLIADVEQAWAADALSYWLVRIKSVPGQEMGEAIGVAGVTRRPGPVWNLYYRLSPEAQGHGYAQEVAAAALAAAAEMDRAVPVVAYLLEHNHGSRRTAERVGLNLVWRGADYGNPDPEAVRLIYADRPLAPELLHALTQRM